MTVLLAAALSALLFGCGEARSAGGIVINEVVSSNKHCLLDDNLGSPDWFELYNTSDQAIDLSGYGVTDDLKNVRDKRYTFEDTVLQPGEYLIVYAATNSGVTASEVPCTGFGLSKGGDFLYLIDAYFNVVTELEIPALLTDVSYARRDDGSYGYCGTPTPGSANGEILSSTDSLYLGTGYHALTISEIVPDAGSGEPWVELYNDSDETIRLEHYYLSDSDQNYLRWQLPAGTLEAHGYLIVYLSGKDADGDGFHSSFKLGSSDDSLYVSNLRGELISEMHFALGVPCGISVVGDSLYTSSITMGEANSTDTFDSIAMNVMDASDPIRINEVLQYNHYGLIDEDGDRSEWVELYNGSGAAVSLADYYLSDNGDSLFKWALPDVSLDSGAYLVIFLSGKDKADSELHAPFGLGSGEDTLYLTCLNGMRVDSIPLLTEKKKDVSVGRDSGGNIAYFAKPTPGYENAHAFESADLLGSFNPEGVFISEVSAVSEVKARQKDWIELYNGGSKSVSLDGWYLTDDPDEPEKWQIKGLSIEAGGYLVIETTSHVMRQTESTATFGISPAGETLMLTDTAGTVQDVFETGALSLNRTSGRIEDDASGARVFFDSPSKGKKNSASYKTGYAGAPAFSRTSFYQEESFTLRLSCDTPGGTIYYTTDGSAPDAGSTRYTEGINISKTTTVRAVVYADGLEPSAIVTHTYMYGSPHTLPVVCLSMDPASFKKVYGVTDRWNKIERACYIEFYEADGKIGTSFYAGVTVKGAGTLIYPQKSLSLHLRGAYGQSSVTYPFFDDCEVHTFSTLVLRNSGQDNDGARLRDSFFSNASRGMYLDTICSRFCILYVNGKYYGIYDFEEDLNASYLAAHYDVDEDAIDVIRRNSTVLDGSKSDFLDLREFCRTADFSKDSNYEKLCARIDMEYFTDYVIAQTYFVNSDMFNQKYWRSQDNTVKWRPVYFDLDFGGTNYKRDMVHSYFLVEGMPSPDGSVSNLDIYCALLQNASWRAYFAERYVEVVYTFYTPERMTAMLNEMVAELEPEMRNHIAHWNTPSSMTAWKKEVESLRTFLEKRPSYALKYMAGFLNISNSQLETLIQKYS